MSELTDPPFDTREETTQVLFKFDGHEVRHTADYRFAVSGPAFDGARDTVYDTAEKAREAITRRNNALEKQSRAKVAVAIDVIGDDGNPYTVRGIHMNTSALLGLPKGDRGILSVYAAVPWIAAAIKRMNAAKKEAARMRDLLSRVEIRGGHGRIEEYEYDKQIELLKARAAVALKTALEIDPKIPGFTPDE